jgi:hypothetical protein
MYGRKNTIVTAMPGTSKLSSSVAQTIIAGTSIHRGFILDDK